MNPERLKNTELESQVQILKVKEREKSLRNYVFVGCKRKLGSLNISLLVYSKEGPSKHIMWALWFRPQS